MTFSRVGPYLIPMLVLVYSSFMIGEQLLGSYRESSRNYALFMGGIAIVCALVVMVRTAFGSGVSDPLVETQSAPESQAPAPRWHYVQVAGIVAMMAAVVLLMETVGYVICFFLLLVGALRLLGVRSPMQIFLISTLTVVFVHFVLVKELQLPLPPGIFEGIL